MDPSQLIAVAALVAQCEVAPATYIEDRETHPPTYTPPKPPLRNRSMLDAVIRAAWDEQEYHPARYQSAVRSPFRR
jgi:hypothetical protein